MHTNKNKLTRPYAVGKADNSGSKADTYTSTTGEAKIHQSHPIQTESRHSHPLGCLQQDVFIFWLQDLKCAGFEYAK